MLDEAPEMSCARETGSGMCDAVMVVMREVTTVFPSTWLVEEVHSPASVGEVMLDSDSGGV